MTKEEMKDLLGFVQSNWNIRGLTKYEGDQMAKTWWDLLGQHPFDVAMSELRRYAFETPYQPRPAEIARRTIDATIRASGGAPPPPVKVAVDLAEDIVSNANAGTPVKEPNEWVITSMRELKHYSRMEFEEVYSKAVARFYEEYSNGQ